MRRGQIWPEDEMQNGRFIFSEPLIIKDFLCDPNDGFAPYGKVAEWASIVG